MPSTTARWSSAARVVARDQPTSTGSAGPSTRSSSRPAWAVRAAGERPDTGQWSTGGVDVGGRGPVPGASSSSRGRSTSTCALVPLIPKEDTAARLGPFPGGHSAASVNSDTEPSDQSTWVEGSSTCKVRGRTPYRMACTILITPATPAADWVWPMFDFTEPSSSGRSRSWP